MVTSPSGAVLNSTPKGRIIENPLNNEMLASGVILTVKDSEKDSYRSPWSWSPKTDHCLNKTTQVFLWNLPELSTEEKATYRNEWIEFISNIPAAPKFSGRGIVYTSYPKVLRETIRSIKFLRHWGCKLPVEVFHFDNELSSFEISQLELLPNVKVLDLATLSKLDGNRFNFQRKNAESRLFQAKGGSLIYSSFDEVLFLDSDNMPIKDPTFLFETSAFIETNSIFWKGNYELVNYRFLEDQER